METLLVQGNSKADIKIFENLAKRLGLKSKFIDLEAIEDIALAKNYRKDIWQYRQRQ